ncbi:PIN-like domain-containing protein [uncultured Ruegeria sp.]|uniref:PIN-like domain-containing protein n=1 Tax=uncultured Ruegeria sp. TaxID=259304 RepID=UPI002636E96B|nr:PIN-like domain-containing protein [uncultured Ruegeria sp.]
MKKWVRNLLGLPENFGTEGMTVDPLDDLVAVFERNVAISALPALIDALDPDPTTVSLSDTALGFDANVFLRLADDNQSALVVDYLTGVHKAPLVLPGQAIQEFWNNQTEAIPTVSKKLGNSFDSLKKAVNGIDDEFEQIEKIENLLDEFKTEHGAVYDEATVKKTASVLQNLRERAVVPFCPRAPFNDLVAHRNKTKTPPGFKDSGDGDFFVWADLLYGLKSLQHQGTGFSRLVFVTNDTKKDWSREGIAHPILAAEANALLDVSFETWTLKQLVKAVEAETT